MGIQATRLLRNVQAENTHKRWNKIKNIVQPWYVSYCSPKPSLNASILKQKNISLTIWRWSQKKMAKKAKATTDMFKTSFSNEYPPKKIFFCKMSSNINKNQPYNNKKKQKNQK